MVRAPFLLIEKLAKYKLRPVRGIENLPPTPPFMVAANHVGFFDGPALTTAIFRHYQQPVHYLTLDIMWRAWGGPLATKYFGMVRLNPRDKQGSLDTMVSILDQGKIAGIFPEGARNGSRQLLPGKTGAIRMALASGVPLIPVGIINTTGRSFFQASSSFFKPDQGITISFGPAVNLDEYMGKPIDKALLNAATTKLMVAIGQQAGKSYPY